MQRKAKTLTLDFTPRELQRALAKGCLTHKQRIYMAELLNNSDIAEHLTVAVKQVKKHNPLSVILLSAVLMGFEAGLKLAKKV